MANNKKGQKPTESDPQKYTGITEDDYMDALSKASQPLPKKPTPNQLDDEDTDKEEEG